MCVWGGGGGLLFAIPGGFGRGAHSEGYGNMNYDIIKVNINVMSSMAFALN